MDMSVEICSTDSTHVSGISNRERLYESNALHFAQDKGICRVLPYLSRNSLMHSRMLE